MLQRIISAVIIVGAVAGCANVDKTRKAEIHTDDPPPKSTPRYGISVEDHFVINKIIIYEPHWTYHTSLNEIYFSKANDGLVATVKLLVGDKIYRDYSVNLRLIDNNGIVLNQAEVDIPKEEIKKVNKQLSARTYYQPLVGQVSFTFKNMSIRDLRKVKSFDLAIK